MGDRERTLESGHTRAVAGSDSGVGTTLGGHEHRRLMFARIVRHEWRLLTADATVLVVTATFAAAIGYGVWNGARWIAFQRQALLEAEREEAQRFERLKAQVFEIERSGKAVSPFQDPRSPSNAGGRFGQRFAMLPPGPLAALAIGQSDLLPYYFKVSTDARQNIIAATEIENPQRLLVGRLDLSFVIIYLYPLLILGLTYNMLSAEQEQGTLALALSQSVSLERIATGKVTLRALLLVGMTVLFSGVALVVTGAELLAAGTPARLLLWIAAVAAYGAFWFSLAILVASFGQASATNATTLAAVWLALVVLLPSLLNLTAATLVPVPSRVEMVQAVRQASDEATAAGSKLLVRYYEDHPELATGDTQQAMNDASVIRVAIDDDVERRARPVIERYERQIAGQQALVDRFGFLSPSILMQGALNDVAGTGTARHRHFMAQVDEFHRVWRRHFVPLIFQKAKFTAGSYEAIPRFQYHEEKASDVALRIAVSLAGLVLPAAAIGWIGLRRLRRFSVVG
jgi:ABC-2 type transport system permease protein